ncbi:MAG: sodium ion-translocating decarboxylase subunit beta, partial [Anaerolineales bacterium]|nr:sodium ion-translocating decarboxylase subunit beta [Anaerolineales bacterium]
MDFGNVLQLFMAPTALTWKMVVMMIVGGVLVYLAIAKDMEPVLLLPIGFGAILTNLPLTGIASPEGLLGVLYDVGIATEIFPLLLFIGLGAMTDFGPLLENPGMAMLGAAGHLGIFVTILLALVFGFDLPQAGSIGVIGTMDGPTAIFVAARMAPDLLAPITVVAYSYMSLVPLIQPPV